MKGSTFLKTYLADNRGGWRDARAVGHQWALLYALAFVALCTPAGCDSTQKRDDAEDLPTIGEAAPFSEFRLPEDQQPGDVIYAHVMRASFPIDTNLDAAWELVDTSQVEPGILKTLHANGLRIGVLNRDDAEPFLAALPEHIESVWQGLVIGEREVHMRLGTTVMRRAAITVVDGEGKHTPITLGSGEMRALVSGEILDDGRVALTSTPQHYRRKQTLVVRQPWETLRDGTVFDDLAMRTVLSPDHLFVMAVYVEPKEDPEPDAGNFKPDPKSVTPIDPPEPSEPMDTNNETDDVPTQPTDAETNAPAKPAVEPEPDDVPKQAPTRRVVRPQKLTFDRVGHLLLSGVRLGRPVKFILLISAEPGRRDAPAAAGNSDGKTDTTAGDR